MKKEDKEHLVIGISYKDEWVYAFRLKLSAQFLQIPLKIIYLNELTHPDLSTIDGLFIPGGDDISPSLYLDKVDESLQNYIKNNLHLVNFTKTGKERDQLEISLLNEYLNNSTYKTMPLLGICRGMQMMAVAHGIPLYLDLKAQVNIPNRSHKFDKITDIEENSLLCCLYEDHKPLAYKLHHQAVNLEYYRTHKKLYPNLKFTAFSQEKEIVEAIEYTTRPALGVQFHPERSSGRTSFPIMKWFLLSALEYKANKK